MRVIEPPPLLMEQIKNRYSEAHRAYHTWAHIESLLGHYEAYKGLLRDPTRVLWAIYYHDAVYDPAAQDNEVRSAALMREQGAPYLPDARIVQVEKMILATIKHQMPEGLGFDVRSDCAAFLDFDLAILAAPDEEFDAYEANVRKEYAFVPEETFVGARKAVLEGFLARPQLYFSPMLARQWTERARANLRRSLGKLSTGIAAA